MPPHAPLNWKIRVDKSKGDIGLSLTNNPSGVGVTVCGLNLTPIPTPAPNLTLTLSLTVRPPQTTDPGLTMA